MPLSFSEIDSLNSAGQTPQVDGGRVTTLLPDNYENARSITILDAPDEGRLTVNPDNSLALVMTGSDYVGTISFQVEIVNANGQTSRETIELSVDAPSQESGWGLGSDHYMLETDADGELVLETGEDHRDVYVSRDADALSLSDIAALERISVSDVTGEWLVANSEYGANSNMALAQDAGALLWSQLAQEDSGSHWLRLEKGYTYDGFEGANSDLFPNGVGGDNPLHPSVITSYGTGEQPVISTAQVAQRDDFANIVVHDVHFTEKISLVAPDETGSENIIFDSVTFTEQGGISVIDVNSVTIREASFSNIEEETPINGIEWQASPDRDHGIYSSGATGLLIEDSTFVQIGWGDGYSADADGDDPQPPSLYTHNVYISQTVRDLTFRNNISAEGSSYGANLRSGGFVEDNLFFENNAGVVVSGGIWNGSGPVGNFSLLSGNVVTSAAYKEAYGPGALAQGIYNGAVDTTLIGNIVAHQTDPNLPGDLESQPQSNSGLINEYEAFYDDTIVYNWYGSNAVLHGFADETSQNTEDLDITDVEAATIANLAKILLNDASADGTDLADWVIDNEVSADDLNDFFQQAFDTAQTARGSATDVRFVPTEISDGVRWDNRENWSTGDIAGTNVNDRVDLGGNWVVYGGTNTIQTLDFGAGGELEATHGRLNVTGQTTGGTGGATLTLSSAGQFWMEGGFAGTSALNVVQDGGRFANTGVITGNVNLFIDDGQALLSAEGGDFVLGQGETLTIRGADAQAGFDGALNREGILRFDAGSDVVIASDSTGLGSIGEFYSGAYNAAPRVDSNIHLNGADLTVDLSDTWLSTGSYVLMNADEISGTFGSFDIEGLGNRSATLTINYNTDEVVLDIASGSGVSVRTVGSDTTPPVIDTPEDDESNDDSGSDDGGSNSGGNDGSDGSDDSNGDTSVLPAWMIAELDEATSDVFVFNTPGVLSTSISYVQTIDDRDSSGTTISILTGTGKNDKFYAGDGDDVVSGNDGDDLVWGGSGNDVIYGNRGSDIIYADRDDDYVEGNGGDDYINGVGGDDWLIGGGGSDNINGGSGSDRINGGNGSDILTGGSESDVFIFANDGGDWNDIITDFKFDQDTLLLGTEQSGYLSIDDVDVLDYNGSTVITFEDNYILLQGVGVNTIVNNAGAVFGGADDLLPG
ncbi:MAG: calcium-binding protein [Roseobacter sp.]